jgi:hypothetical protein
MSLKKSFLFVALLTFGITFVCYGQAWIPPKGMAALSINYQYTEVENHIGSNGERVYGGGIFSNSVMADFSYSLTDKLAVSVNLPFVTSKYDGPGPHKILNADGTFTIPIDDGTYHSTFQDFTFQGRYNIAANPMQITPFVRVIIPSHNYEWFAHAAAGVRTKRVQFGTYAGRVLDPIFPNAYFQARYGFTFHEKILDISRHSSNLDLELGYFVTPDFRVFGLAIGQYSHGGIDMADITNRVSTNPYFLNHDRITRYNSLNVGGGASYTISNAIDVYGALTNTVSGRNGHAVKYGVTFGMSYGFQGFHPPNNNMQASNSRDSKAVCLCALKENGMK